MAANNSLRLIDRILRKGTLTPVLRAGITPEMLAGPAEHALRYIFEWYQAPRTRGTLPPRDEVMRRIPGLKALPRTEDRIKLRALAELVRNDYGRREYEKILEASEFQREEGLEEAVNNGISRLRKLQTTLAGGKEEGGGVIDVFEMLPDVASEQLRKIAQSGGLIGLPFPYAQLNQELFGMQEGDLVVMWGPPKSGKTWLALNIIRFLIENTSARAGISTKEMNHKKWLLRIAAGVAKIAYSDARGHFLDDGRKSEDLAMYLQTLTKLRTANRKKGGGRLSLFRGMRPGTDPFEYLEEQIRSTGVDVTLADAAYLFGKSRAWEDQSSISTKFKQLAEDTHTVIIVTVQENERRAVDGARGGLRTTGVSLAYTQAWNEDCDLSWHLTPRHRVTGNTEVLTDVCNDFPYSREGPLAPFVTTFKPVVDFEANGKKPFSMLEGLMSDEGESPEQVRRKKGDYRQHRKSERNQYEEATKEWKAERKKDLELDDD